MKLILPPNAIRRPRARNRGFGVVEIVVAIFVISTAIFSIMTVAKASLTLSRQVLFYTQAGFLIEEGSEGVRMLRDTSWSNLSSLTPDSPYRIVFSSNKYEATTTTALVDGIFDRTFSVSAVLRDGSDDIAQSGTADPGTKKINLNVSWWNGLSTTTRSVTFYITDLLSS